MPLIQDFKIGMQVKFDGQWYKIVAVLNHNKCIYISKDNEAPIMTSIEYVEELKK